MIPYVRYDRLTGVITDTGKQSEESVDHEHSLGVPILVGEADGAKHYVDLTTLQIVEKTENLATIDGLVISNIPNASAVYVDYEFKMIVNDGYLELSFTYPGKHQIIIHSPQHRERTFEITYNG